MSKLSKMLHLQPLHPPSDVQEPYINKLDVHLVKDRRRCRSDRNPGENHFFARSEGLCFWQPTDARQRHESLGLQSLTATTSTGQQLEARLRAIKRALRSLLHKVTSLAGGLSRLGYWATFREGERETLFSTKRGRKRRATWTPNCETMRGHYGNRQSIVKQQSSMCGEK